VIEPPIYKTIRTGVSGDCAPPRHFTKGTAGGRKRGSINYITAVMKDAVLRGAAESDRAKAKDPSGGLVAYLRSVADEFPTAYMRLLARLIPHDLRLQMRAEINTMPQSADEIRAELRNRGIPIPDHLFAVPRVPGPVLQRRPARAAPGHDEDALGREPLVRTSDTSLPGNEVDRTSETPKRFDNPYNPNRPPAPPYVPGPPALGQLELPWPSRVSYENHCWSWGRPPRVVADNTAAPAPLIDANAKDTDHDRADDETPPQAAE
jgi:hypothetical protein